MALTDTEIRKAKARSSAYRMSDGGGLYLQVPPAGGKLWRWKYRFDGREKLMTFGGYPDVSLSLARERHVAARKLLATGTDPMSERKAEKAAAENSFQSVANLWLAHWQDGKSPRHVNYVTRRMDADILPCLGSRPIAAIEALASRFQLRDEFPNLGLGSSEAAAIASQVRVRPLRRRHNGPGRSPEIPSAYC